LVCVIIGQVGMFIRQLFNGSGTSSAFVLILALLTIIFYIFMSNTDLISPEKFPDDEGDMNEILTTRWWNYFKHPLIVGSLSQSKGQETNKCNQPLTRLPRQYDRPLQLQVPTLHRFAAKETSRTAAKQPVHEARRTPRTGASVTAATLSRLKTSLKR
jgi:hypothetical protein